MLLTDNQIRDICMGKEIADPFSKLPYGVIQYPKGMIEPFEEGIPRHGKISYGLTTAGYDLRLCPKKLLRYIPGATYVSAKRFKDPDYKCSIIEEVLPTINGDTGDIEFLLKPRSYYLGQSYEYLNIPSRIKGRCVGKSTLARCGVHINTTPLEGGWKGYLTIEIGNDLPIPTMIWGMEGIAQLEFDLLSQEPRVDYSKKNGIYQGQTDITVPRVRECNG